MKLKCFISTGCSFTDVPIPEIQDLSYVELENYKQYSLSWPVHVNNELKTIPKYRGKGASGNGIISRTTIYEVTETLKQFNSDEILVGIMWSGYYRQEIYSVDRQDYYLPERITRSKVDKSNNFNPISISGEPNYYKIMPYWNDELSTLYYKNIYDEIGSYILTIEHILRTQWFLKTHNIKYFMTTYMSSPNVLPNKNIINHSDIKYLYDMIDFDNFLNVDSEYDWCKRFQDESTWDNLNVEHKHPNTLQHKAFAEQVILPHLQNKGWL